VSNVDQYISEKTRNLTKDDWFLVLKRRLCDMFYWWS